MAWQRRGRSGGSPEDDAGAVRVEVVDGSDVRLDQALELEVATMVALGDPEEEVREEFAPYADHSLYFVAHRHERPGTVVGMGRLVPSSAERGNKTLRDLGSIASWHGGAWPVVGRSAAVPDDVPAADALEEAFLRRSGCAGLDAVWDVATLATELQAPPSVRGRVADALAVAMVGSAVAAARSGGTTHLTLFTETAAHRYFLRLGYPLRPLFGLGPMVYDTVGTGVGMVARPSWLPLADLEPLLADPPTPHLRRLARSVASPGVLLPG